MTLNLQLLEATSTTRLTFCTMYMSWMYCASLSCALLAALQQPVETSSLQIKLVYYFIFEVLFFSYWHLHWCFLNVVALQGLDLCLVVLPLIVEDCLKLQHYYLAIIGNFYFRFVNCNDWTVIFFQLKFNLTILCNVRQSVEELRIYLVLICYQISTQPWVNTLRWPKSIYIHLACIQHKVVLLTLRTVFAVGFW